MTAALLAPGPSLTSTFDPDFAGLRVGINRAGLAFPCDWLAALDLPVYLNWGEQIHAAHCLTNRNTRDSLARRKLRWADVATITEDLACPVPGWTGYSATCALVLLESLGATEVKVYGADWAGEADWDGKASGENRTADRWAAERVIWTGIVNWLRGRGVSVERVGANGSEH